MIRGFTNKADFVYFTELEEMLDKIGICKKKHDFCGISRKQYYIWKTRNKVPARKFWEIRAEISNFHTREFIKNMFRLKVFDKDLLNEIKEIVDET